MKNILVLLLSLCIFVACNKDTSDIALTDESTPYVAPDPEPKLLEGDQRVVIEAAPGEYETMSKDDEGALSKDAHPSPAMGMEDLRTARSVQKMRDAATQRREQQTNNAVTPHPTQKSGTVTGESAGLLFTWSKGPCYGDCAQFDVAALADGTLVYTGRKNTRLLGTYRLKPMSYKFDEIIASFNQFLSTSPAKVYPQDGDIPVDDQATVLNYPDSKGGTKSIRVFADAPESFERLNELLEDLVDNGRWEK